jgi:hypothetical protein
MRTTSREVEKLAQFAEEVLSSDSRYLLATALFAMLGGAEAPVQADVIDGLSAKGIIGNL